MSQPALFLRRYRSDCHVAIQPVHALQANRGVSTALSLITTILFSMAPTEAAELLLEASKDNTLYETPSGTISNGKGQHLFAGRTSSGLSYRRGLIQFDLAGALPPGTSILSAKLTLNMSMTTSGPTPVSLHPALRDWGEGDSTALGGEGGGAAAEPGDATWYHRFSPTEMWDNPGGDFDPIASATTVVTSNGSYTWQGAELTARVQLWIDDPDQNFGWVIAGDESTVHTSKRFDTRENVTPAFRPSLQITYGDTQFLRGDCNSDTIVDLADVITMLDRLYATPGAPCRDACDANDDGSFDISDPVSVLSALFVAGATSLPLPYPDCGTDITDDDPLDCDSANCP